MGSSVPEEDPQHLRNKRPGCSSGSSSAEWLPADAQLEVGGSLYSVRLEPHLLRRTARLDVGDSSLVTYRTLVQ